MNDDDAGLRPSPNGRAFAPMYVEEVKIRHFKGVDSLDVPLEPKLTLLVGRNNSGKSRVLAALGLALGGVRLDGDELTVGGSEDATIDVVVAPAAYPTGNERVFTEQLSNVLDPATVSQDPLAQRFAWRTTVHRSAEGLGTAIRREVLSFDATRRSWTLTAVPKPLRNEQLRLFETSKIDTGRDLAGELSNRSSAIRRVLNNLEIADRERRDIEARLEQMGAQIIAGSGPLRALAHALQAADGRVGGFGRAEINPVPPRLEELARSVSIDLDAGTGALPMRLHGAGPRSLASLLVQSVLYDRRLGQDGSTTRPLPVTLVEEPEAHLHPQMQAEVPELLADIGGQVVVTTHSPGLVTATDHLAIRLLRSEGGRSTVVALRPADSDTSTSRRALRPTFFASEMEKLKRTIERPFGELLFASAVVVGDGATERAFLPPVLRHALGAKAHGVVVVDPGGMKNCGPAVVRFADLIGIPFYVFSDDDKDGRQAVDVVFGAVSRTDAFGRGRVIWSRYAGDPSAGGAIERLLATFDPELCRAAVQLVQPDANLKRSVLELLKDCKGTVGSALAGELIARYPSSGAWPPPILELVQVIDRALTPVGLDGDDDGDRAES
jgi:putative ATP-dependent endonuclease of OLD family